MKSIFVGCISFVMIGVAAFAGQIPQPFKGKITCSFQVGESVGQIVLLASENKLRIEPEIEQTPKIWLLLDETEHKTTVVMHEQKKYLTIPTDFAKRAVGKAMPGIAQKPIKIDSKKIQSTGKSRTILGYDCKQYTAESDGSTVELWMTDALGTFPTFAGSPLPEFLGNEEIIFFPMEMKIYSSNNSDQDISFIVVDINLAKIAESDFAAPSGYEPMNMFGDK